MRKIFEKDKDEKHIILENFNLHHLKWEKNHVIANVKAYELIVMIEKYRLKKTFSIEIITWRRDISESTIDLTFVTFLLRKNAINVEITINMNSHSNHYLIKTFFEIWMITIKTRLKRNWKKIDFALLQQTFKKVVLYEKNFTSTSLHDNSKSELDRQMKTFTKLLQKVIKVFTSWIRICSRFKSKFIKKCKRNSREIKKTKRIWQNIIQKND